MGGEMWIRPLRDCRIMQAGDKTTLCELLHPDRPDADGIPVRFSLAHARLAPRENSLPHKLLQSSKVYYVLEGQEIMHVENRKCVVEPGHTFFIPQAPSSG